MVADHPVLVRAPAFLGGGPAPALLRRVDQNFVEGLFRELGADALHDQLRGGLLPRAGDPERVLHLPVHRTFQLVLVELVCDVPGNPRLAPEKVDSIGMVVRRRLPARGGVLGPHERWTKELQAIRGWHPASGATLDEDPDPTRRKAPRLGVPALDEARAAARADAAIRAQQVPLEETTTRLFPVPPDICAHLGSTLFFGVVPVDDPSIAEPGLSPSPSPITYTDAQIEALLPPWLLGAAAAIPAPLGGATVRARQVAGQWVVERRAGSAWSSIQLPDPAGPAPSGQGSLHSFLRSLDLLRLQGLFDEATPHAARDALRRERVAGRTVYDVLRDASEVLVLRTPDAEATLPAALPALSSGTVRAVRGGAKSAVSARAGALTRNEPRFGRADARYVTRVFARIKRADGCPPALYWSAETLDFRVARWFEAPPDGAPIPQIELPDLSRSLLAAARPNVTFKVPTALFNLLRDNAPGDFLEGKGRQGGGGVDFIWICGFNISIIFVCAFIVLFIFLVLLNIVFWWLPFVKICFPIPIPKEES